MLNTSSRTLPTEEKKLWHSHASEVKSGILVTPGLPQFLAASEMKALACSWGKAVHLWQVDKGHELPLGLPQLMMSYTEDGQLPPEVLAAGDERLGVD